MLGEGRATHGGDRRQAGHRVGRLDGVEHGFQRQTQARILERREPGHPAFAALAMAAQQDHQTLLHDRLDEGGGSCLRIGELGEQSLDGGADRRIVGEILDDRPLEMIEQAASRMVGHANRAAGHDHAVIAAAHHMAHETGGQGRGADVHRPQGRSASRRLDTVSHAGRHDDEAVGSRFHNRRAGDPYQARAGQGVVDRGEVAGRHGEMGCAAYFADRERPHRYLETGEQLLKQDHVGKSTPDRVGR